MWHHQVLSVSQITPTFTLLLPWSSSLFLPYHSFSTCLAVSIPHFSSYLPFILCPSRFPCALPSALRQTLCRTQPETQSRLLFPGSLSLCFYASLSFRGPQAEPSPLPLPLSGCHHFLSTLIVPRIHSLTPKHKYNTQRSDKLLLYIYTNII